MPGYANPQNLNRYSYVTNNPLRYTDPTGHMLDYADGGGGSGYTLPDPPDNDYCDTHPLACGNDDNEDDEPQLSPDLTPDDYLSSDSTCASVTYEELETFLNNDWHTYQGSLWAGAGVLFAVGGLALGTCIGTAGAAVPACVVGLLLVAEGIELTYEANEAGDISSYLHSELGTLNPGGETSISLDYTDSDSNFFELNTPNLSYGQNIDFPINALMLQLNIDFWNTN